VSKRKWEDGVREEYYLSKRKTRRGFAGGQNRLLHTSKVLGLERKGRLYSFQDSGSLK